MSDSSHLHANTFLSRVFATTSKGATSLDPPLLSDDNNSRHDGNQDNELVFEEDLNGRTSSNNSPPSIHRSQARTPQMVGSNSNANGVAKPKYLSKLAINVQSESEDSSSDNDLSPESHNSNADIRGPIRLESPPLKPMNESKRKLMRQLETEMGIDDNDYNEFMNYDESDRDSVLLEEGRHRSFANGNERPGMFRQLEQSVMDHFRDSDMNMNFSQFGERAKSLANRALTQLPTSFNPQNSFLQPPPNFLAQEREPHSNEPQTLNSISLNQHVFNARKLPSKERALWMWANVTNLDVFLQDVYDYYLGNGLYCIALQRFLDLTIVVFVIWLSAFIGNCIDYSKLMDGVSNTLSQVYVDKCFSKTSFLQKVFFTILGIVLILRVKHTWEELCDLREIQLFYKYLLNIDDDELQTISWPQVVKKVMLLKQQHTNALVSLIDQGNSPTTGKKDLKSKSRLNAHDIANRLMRKDNYMIAIFNKNILNKALTIPIFNTYFLTKTLEWNLKLCIIDYMFTREGQLKQSVLAQTKRMDLAMGLRKRFKLAGLLSIVLTPFLVVYFVLYFFLKFFYDFKTNPGLLSSREYSPYAKWKMREFNELPHLFEERLKYSVEGANEYLDQFPKEMMNIVMKFLSFISGSLLTVLVIMTVIDHENFLNFELSEGRTVLFYISTLGAVFTVCKNNISSSNYVFDPETSLKYVSQFTHYLPQSWEGRYHSVSVKSEFCQLYNLKLVLIGKEICSLIFLPWILYVSLPSASERIIDFFRDFSVHVDGLGCVCSFAMFNLNQGDVNDKVKGVRSTVDQNKSIRYRFDKNLDNLRKVDDEVNDNELNKNRLPQLSSEPEEIVDDEYFADNDDKMAKSYMHFLESYGETDRKTSIPSQQFNKKVFGRNRDHKQDSMRKSVLRTNYYEKMEETNAGLLSNDTEQYINGLNHSVMLGDALTKSKEIPQGKMEDSNGGVMGLLNQIYRHKD